MDLRKVKKLIELLEESGLSEIEITEGEDKVRITKGGKRSPQVKAIETTQEAEAFPVREPEDINTQTLFGYSDAYKAMEKSYYSLKAPVIPSKTAMALKIAGAGVSEYGKLEGGQYGQT